MDAAIPDTQTAPARMTDDMDLIREAARLTRDLNAAKPLIYWSDFLGSAAIGYAGLYGAITATSTGMALAAALIAALALYRASSFIHELTHIRHSAVPGFRLGWNLIVGIPLFIPSFMYEGVHNLHHQRTRYGTALDPEYLPLALMKPWTLLLFLATAAFGPIAFMLRYAILSPLSCLVPPLRRLAVERLSALAINPAFHRTAPEGDARKNWLFYETLASIWAVALITGLTTGFVPWRAFLIFMGVASVALIINQIRTLVAHLWENEGDPISVTAQYLDSVNVPPPALLPALWAPVGLRYHAIHHLLPGLPYHALGEAHRRLIAAMPAGSTYTKANYLGLPGLLARLIKGTFRASTR